MGIRNDHLATIITIDSDKKSLVDAKPSKSLRSNRIFTQSQSISSQDTLKERVTHWRNLWRKLSMITDGTNWHRVSSNVIHQEPIFSLWDLCQKYLIWISTIWNGMHTLMQKTQTNPNQGYFQNNWHVLFKRPLSCQTKKDLRNCSGRG